ncbi:MAG: 23S rRNA (adenine(2503)-C(2))-methyltransferase RlmN [Phycisphaerae bacterium]|jgi:23S rRNA (adenine2503-C2)-methyltransferase
MSGRRVPETDSPDVNGAALPARRAPGADAAPRRAALSALASSPDAGRVHLLGMDAQRMRDWVASLGQPAYRAAQVLQWIYEKNADSFEQMTNLSKELRTRLAEQACLYSMRVVQQSDSADGTRKLLLACGDGAAVETVWIPADGRNTACLSSQVGCPVGCRFCASGIDGVQRDLSPGEIVEQALHIRRLIRQHTPAAEAAAGNEPGGRLSHIVMMGMGEPLANYEAVVAAIRILNAPWGLNVGARKITVSTVGLPRQIRRLADEQLQLNLALSLHAPDEDLRRELIPWGKVRLPDLLDACAYYFQKTGREITLEYVLLARVNDHAAHARKLAAIARRLRANINLLRYNPVPGLPFERPTAEAAHQFQQQLRSAGANAHLRTSRGRDVAAACGQLRRQAIAPVSPAGADADAANPVG